MLASRGRKAVECPNLLVIVMFFLDFIDVRIFGFVEKGLLGEGRVGGAGRGVLRVETDVCNDVTAVSHSEIAS